MLSASLNKTFLSLSPRINYRASRLPTGETVELVNELMNECLTTPQHEKQIGYCVSQMLFLKQPILVENHGHF